MFNSIYKEQLLTLNSHTSGGGGRGEGGGGRGEGGGGYWGGA